MGIIIIDRWHTYSTIICINHVASCSWLEDQLEARPTPAMSREAVRERLSPIERLLRRDWASLPSAVTIARSNEGGFTPLAHTRMLEKEVVDMVERVYPSVAWRTRSSQSVDAVVLEQLAAKIESARVADRLLYSSE